MNWIDYLFPPKRNNKPVLWESKPFCKPFCETMIETKKIETRLSKIMNLYDEADQLVNSNVSIQLKYNLIFGEDGISKYVPIDPDYSKRDKQYMVDKWFKAFKKYIGFDRVENEIPNVPDSDLSNK